MAAKNLSALERAYFVRKVGNSTPQESLAQIKRRYWMSYLTAPAGATFTDLETQWLIKMLTVAGKTITSTFVPDLWVANVSAIGQTPTKQMNGNKMIFYSVAP